MHKITLEDFHNLKSTNTFDLLYKKWNKEKQKYIDVTDNEKELLKIKSINKEKDLNLENIDFLNFILEKLDKWNTKLQLIESVEEKYRYNHIYSKTKDIIESKDNNYIICVYFKEENNFKKIYSIGIINTLNKAIETSLAYPTSQVERNKRKDGIIGLCGHNINSFMTSYAFETLKLDKLKLDVISPKLKEQLSQIKISKEQTDCSIS